tara:strand:+ start:183 stop:335 length:153 start_codon:yes stop_codon:yes gene_type:complete
MTFKTFPEDMRKKKKDTKLIFFIKAVIWFFATVGGGFWVSTWFSSGWGMF